MDLDRDAQRILDLATEARAPGADDKARVEKKLGALLGVGIVASAVPAASTQAAHAAGTTASAAKVATSGATALKWWIASAVIASAVTGYVALSSRPAPTAPVNAPAAYPPPPTAPPVAVEPAPAVAEVPAANPPTDPAPALRAPQKPGRAAVRKPDTASALSQELELLHRAQAAWRAHDAARAMTLIDEHRARFPRSELRLERDGLRVLTLCELGRKSEATALAHKLLERAPRSPLRATIEESCALK